MTEDFWDWLPKAYGDVGDEPTFTKYDMEVAFAAGAEAEAKRMWVGLTDEEKQEWIDAMPYDPQPRHCMTLVNIIEAKLKEKNT